MATPCPHPHPDINQPLSPIPSPIVYNDKTEHRIPGTNETV